MNGMTKIAVKFSGDPMHTVLECLFEKKAEVLISKGILELLKRAHSYTMIPNGMEEVYTFHKRERGTEATFFSFNVISGGNENKVSNLEYTTEWIMLVKPREATEVAEASHGNKVYVMLAKEDSQI